MIEKLRIVARSIDAIQFCWARFVGDDGATALKFYSWGSALVAVSLNSPEIFRSFNERMGSRSGKYQEPKEANPHQRQGHLTQPRDEERSAYTLKERHRDNRYS